MLKSLFLCIWFLLCLVEVLTAQDEQKHSIAELSILLQKSNSDLERVSLLLEAALVYISRPGAERNDMDTALYFTGNALSLSNKLKESVWQARCFRMYSQLYRESNQIEQGKKYADSAISILTKLDQKESLGDAYFELQHYYNVYSDNEWDLKIKYAELAEDLYKEGGHKQKQAATLKQLGDFYQIKYKDSIALKNLQEALAIYQSIKYPRLHSLYDLIGFVLSKLGDFKQALKYGLLAMETAEKLKADSVELCTIYNRVGLTCYNLARYVEAGDYFTRSFSMAIGAKDTTAAILVSANVMSTYVRLEKQQELIDFLRNNKFIYDKGNLENKSDYTSIYIRAYLLTNDFKKAEPFVKPLLRLAESTDNFYVHSRLYRAIIPYYFAAGQYREMYKYLPRMDDFCKQRNFVVGLADNYLWWYKADSALAKYDAAISHYKLYKEANDSSLRMTASRQINELLVEYESVKKDQAIASNKNNILLLTNKAKLQQEQLRRNKVVKNMTFGLVALLLVITALLYNRYRLKQKTNKKLELQQQEIARKNQSLQHLLDEKEWLLKEIHHRVKNNLQIVMSLLNSQSAYIDNEPALTAIHDSQHRVHAMSLIHQKLYGAENVSSIDMSSYIRELVSYLRDSFNTGRHLRFEFNITPLELDVSQAVPVGLILNEAITNSIKYAFPNEKDGVITISLSNTSLHHYLLTISDNGIGMPLHFTGKKPGSLGMSLMAGLAEDLEGQFAIENNNGTTIKISFVHDVNIKRPDLVVSSFVTSN